MNLWQQFQKLIPSDVTLVGTVVSVTNDLYTLDMPQGGSITARSPSTVSLGAIVFVKNGVIIGDAPDLGTLVTIEL